MSASDGVWRPGTPKNAARKEQRSGSGDSGCVDFVYNDVSSGEAIESGGVRVRRSSSSQSADSNASYREMREKRRCPDAPPRGEETFSEHGDESRPSTPPEPKPPPGPERARARAASDVSVRTEASSDEGAYYSCGENDDTRSVASLRSVGSVYYDAEDDDGGSARRLETLLSPVPGSPADSREPPGSPAPAPAPGVPEPAPAPGSPQASTERRSRNPRRRQQLAAKEESDDGEAADETTPAVYAWSRTLRKVMWFDDRDWDASATLLADFWSGLNAEDGRALALLREGLSVKLHARMGKTRRRVSVVGRVLLLLDEVSDPGRRPADARLVACVREGQALKDADGLSVAVADIACVGLGPTTSQLHLTVARQHGELHSADAIDHSKRLFSVFGGGRALDVEVALRGGERRAQIAVAQATALAAARALHKYARARRSPCDRAPARAAYGRFLATRPAAIEDPAQAHVLNYHVYADIPGKKM